MSLVLSDGDRVHTVQLHAPGHEDYAGYAAATGTLQQVCLTSIDA